MLTVAPFKKAPPQRGSHIIGAARLSLHNGQVRAQTRPDHTRPNRDETNVCPETLGSMRCAPKAASAKGHWAMGCLPLSYAVESVQVI